MFGSTLLENRKKMKSKNARRHISDKKIKKSFEDLSETPGSIWSSSSKKSSRKKIRNNKFVTKYNETMDSTDSSDNNENVISHNEYENMKNDIESINSYIKEKERRDKERFELVEKKIAKCKEDLVYILEILKKDINNEHNPYFYDIDSCNKNDKTIISESVVVSISVHLTEILDVPPILYPFGSVRRR